MTYYIGVDGGGTKTAYALFDEEKNVIAEVKTEGSNHENLEGSFDEAADIIWNGICDLLKKADVSLDSVGFTLMGLAGIDHPYQHDEMCSRMRNRGLENFEIFNDGFIVVKAGASGKAAIGYNCGTGTCCNAIDLDGKMVQLGGFGEFSDDKGNGTWVATKAFKLIYDDIVLGLEKTSMTQMFKDEFKVEDKDSFLATLAMAESEDRGRFIMRLIDFFFEASKMNDKPVLAAIDEMSERGADYIVSHLNSLNFGDGEVEIVLSGSIHTKLPNEVYLDCLKKKIGERSEKKVKYIKLTQAPVTGCVNWIFQEYKN